jgi:pheromone shutdown protein TraB
MNVEGENTVVMVLGAGHLDGVVRAFTAGASLEDIKAISKVSKDPDEMNGSCICSPLLVMCRRRLRRRGRALC